MFNVEYIKCETRNDKYCFSVFNILKQLLATDDTDLFEKVKNYVFVNTSLLLKFYLIITLN